MNSQSFILENEGREARFISPGSGHIPARRLRICFLGDTIARITFTTRETFSDTQSRIVVNRSNRIEFQMVEEFDRFRVFTKTMTVCVAKATGALTYLDSRGNVLHQEPARGGKFLKSRIVKRNTFASPTEAEILSATMNVDGARAAATILSTAADREAYEARLDFDFFPDEAVFGLGSHEEGYGNLRGRSRNLYQQNMKAVVPHLVSTRGYGILLDCCSLMTFHDDEQGTFWWADCVPELDFYFLAGGDFAGVIRNYRQLTGAPPLPPIWAFGYVQSKERYVTASEMLEIVREYRRREIPLDLIVLDWKSWPNRAGWGQKSFDLTRFPDPGQFIDDLHSEDVRLMMSIWPIMTGGCENQRELLARGEMLGNHATYNAFDPNARDSYWQQARRGLFSHGVDAWWCDCTEPFEADWTGAVKPNPQHRLTINTAAAKLYIDEADINAYSLVHSQGIYEGQRTTTSAKRVLNLTRGSYAGQSRYGTITWNGDICGTWDCLRRTVAEGLNFCATGEPYWTVDAGGFFVDHRPDLWFWRGDYPPGTRGLTPIDALQPDPADTGSRDLGFHELYVRWLQYSVFLPMMRSHGTDVPREIWRFGEPGNPFYDAIATAIRLRYLLLPTIYSLAARVTFGDGSILRPLALAYPADLATHNIDDAFLFGPLLVCPVLNAQYYGPGSTPISNPTQSRKVYLPANTDWYCVHTYGHKVGGQTVFADTPLDRIPVFAPAGTILVLAREMQHTGQLRSAPHEICVFTGHDGSFTWYEDAGDGYEYEAGSSAQVTLFWSESSGELTLAAREGSFHGLTVSRELNIRFVTPLGSLVASLHYSGAALRINLHAAIPA